MDKPLISVIMPIYNGAAYLAAALESIFEQTYKPIEIICINDGSTDGTAVILDSYGARITRIDASTNVGIAASRNKGLAIARGTFIALMDADDIARPEKFAKQIAQLTDDPSCSISFTMMECFISPELSEAVKQTRECPVGPMNGPVSGTALIRRGVFETVGLFNEDFRVGEFVDWIARATDMNLVYHTLPEVLYLRRIHDTNTGVIGRNHRVDYITAVRRALRRREKT